MTSNSKDKFRGLGVALVTPFTTDGKVDYPGLERLVEDLILNKVDYLLALGTTSEYPTLSENEQLDVVRCITSANAGRLPVLLGMGGADTQGVVHNVRRAGKLPVDAILSVTPYYNKPSQQGLVEHYKAVASSSPLPVILYNVPGRTSCNIQAETTLRIAESSPNVIGIKEASGNMRQILHLLNRKPKDFLVISGDDLITLPLMAAGMDGLISVLANAYPAETANLVHLALNDQFIKARLFHDKLFDISQACFKEGNPSGIKAILAAQGKIKNVLRLPLTPVSDNLSNEIHTLLQL